MTTSERDGPWTAPEAPLQPSTTLGEVPAAEHVLAAQSGWLSPRPCTITLYADRLRITQADTTRDVPRALARARWGLDVSTPATTPAEASWRFMAQRTRLLLLERQATTLLAWLGPECGVFDRGRRQSAALGFPGTLAIMIVAVLLWRGLTPSLIVGALAFTMRDGLRAIAEWGVWAGDALIALLFVSMTMNAKDPGTMAAVMAVGIASLLATSWRRRQALRRIQAAAALDATPA